MIVKIQKPIEFVNECNCLVDLDELKNAIIWYSEKPVTRLKKIYMHGMYPAISIYKEKIHVHRLLMMYWIGRKLMTEEYVHHKDECKTNSSRKNLEIMQSGVHQSHHNKGKELSEQHRKLIGEAGKKRKGIKVKKRCDIPIGELKELFQKGHSINAISKHFKVDWTTIKARLNENPELLEVS